MYFMENSHVVKMCTQIVKVRIQWDKDFNNIASNIQVTSMSYNFLHRRS